MRKVSNLAVAGFIAGLAGCESGSNVYYNSSLTTEERRALEAQREPDPEIDYGNLLLGIGGMALQAHGIQTNNPVQATTGQSMIGIVSSNAGKSQINQKVIYNNGTNQSTDSRRATDERSLAYERVNAGLSANVDIELCQFVDGNNDGVISIGSREDYVNFNDAGDFFRDSTGIISINQRRYGGKTVRLELIKLGDRDEIWGSVEKRIKPLGPNAVSGYDIVSTFDVESVIKEDEQNGTIWEHPIQELALHIYVDGEKTPSSGRTMRVYTDASFPRGLLGNK